MNKTFITLAAAMLMLCGGQSYATSWRINNDNTKGTQFADINAAMSSEEVVDGDTLYIDPGSTIASDQNVTKRVVIIGSGYNPYDRPYGSAVISGNLYLQAEGSKVMGMELNGAVYIAANNITVERCKCTNAIGRSGSSYTDATIRQCYISKGISGDGKTSTKSASWTIENNIIVGVTYDNKCIYSLYNATISNNLLINPVSYNGYCLRELATCTVKNNIIIHTTTADQTLSSLSECTLSHNIISQEWGDNNLVATTVAEVLTGDYERYTLVENSPAAGYGDDGNDCGIFGGSFPYVAGGLPLGHPYFTKAVIGSNVSDGVVNVSLQIKVQDE